MSYYLAAFVKGAVLGGALGLALLAGVGDAGRTPATYCQPAGPCHVDWDPIADNPYPAEVVILGHAEQNESRYATAPHSVHLVHAEGITR